MMRDTAELPSPPAPRLMSARISPGRQRAAMATASASVAATPTTRWPQLTTNSSMSMAMIGSSSMISTSVAAAARRCSRAPASRLSPSAAARPSRADAVASGTSSSEVSSSSLRCAAVSPASTPLPGAGLAEPAATSR